MLNETKYRVPKQTPPENKILWIINGLEQKVKKLERINKELLEACKEALKDFELLKEYIPRHRNTITQLKQTIAKAEEAT